MTAAENPGPTWVAHAAALRHAGWHGVFPLRPGTKGPPPTGVTGADGEDPSRDMLNAWAAKADPASGLAIRMAPDVCGIDADLYKRALALAELEAAHGPLPDTIMTTSRGDGSGIRLYRIPPDTVLPGQLGLAVEAIQRHHRYAVCSPSVHPETGEPYRWIDTGTGEILNGPPRPEDLPMLPDGWLTGWDPEPQEPPAQPTLARHDNDRPSPADWWTHDAPGSFLDDLLGDGWTISHHHGEDTYLTRPGKETRLGHSAVLGPSGVLRVFTAELGELRTVARPTGNAVEAAITRFAYLAATRHGGDLSAAARWALDARDGPSATNNPPVLADTAGTQDEPAPRRFELLRGARIRDLPQPTPLIDGYLDHASLALIYGKYGTGKTFVGLDWAFHVAAGRAWQGRQVEQGTVCVIAAEGSTGMAARFDAWCEHHQIDPDSMSDLYWLPEAAQMAKAVDGDDLYAVLAEIAPRLVVMDTVARTAVGINENDATELGEWIHGVDTLARRLAQTTGIHPCMLGVHHAGKDAERGARGNTALPAATAALFRVTGDATFAELVCERQKDREASPRRSFTLRKVGESVVPDWHELGQGRAEANQDILAANVARILDVIGEPGVGATATNWERAVLEAGTCGHTQFHAIKSRLAADGYVARTGQSRTSPRALTPAGREWLEGLT